MTYLKEAFAELWRQDGLVVMARGLGVKRLLAKFLLLHCMHGDVPKPPPEAEDKQEEGDEQEEDDEHEETITSGPTILAEFTERKNVSGETGDRGPTAAEEAPSPTGQSSRRSNDTGERFAREQRVGRGRGGLTWHTGLGKKRSRDGGQPPISVSEGVTPRPLVLCLNATGEEDLFLDALMADGVPPNRLPEIVDAECTPGQRQSLYKFGGVFLVTSRVLIVDLLNKAVLPGRISGMVVHKAHRVVETSTEAFILRIFREGNPTGFVKGFTDDPESLLSGFGKLEKILRNLGVAKVYLWPRFHSLVAESLERKPPEVEELVQGLTGPTKEVQQAIVVLMDHTLKELRGSAPSLDSAELTVENCIFNSFDRSVKRQLEPEWHRVGFKTKQLLQDLKTLRSLLDYMFRYDAITFYQLLLAEKSKAAAVRDPPLWIGTAAAERLFVTAKARIYKVIPKREDDTLAGKSNSRKKARATHGPQGGGSIHTHDKITPPKSNSAHELSLVLEENAKWRLAADVLKEIRDVYDSRCREASGGVAKGRRGGVSRDEATAGGARVLVLLRDEHTCAQLRQHSALGGSVMMKKRFIEFVRDSEERSTRKASRRGVTRGRRGGRWTGKPRGGGMTGVGVGASPAFFNLSRGGDKGSDEDGGETGGEERQKSGAAQERMLLRRTADLLEAELETTFARRQFHEPEGKSSSKGDTPFRQPAAVKPTTKTTARRRPQQKPQSRQEAAREKKSDKSGEANDQSPGRRGETGKGKRKGTAERGRTGKKKAKDAWKTLGDVTDPSADHASDDPFPPREERLEGTASDGESDEGEDEDDDDERVMGQEGKGRRNVAGARGAGDGSEPPPTCREPDGTGGGEGVRFHPLPSLHVVMFSYAQAEESLNILQDLEPDFVVLYDPDAAFVRKLEAYQATRPRDRAPLAVYFMLYEQSVEEQRYLTSLDRETKAFKRLIEEKARMTVPVRTITSAALQAERSVSGNVTRLSVPLTAGGSAGGEGTMGGLVTSRSGGGRRVGREERAPRVVVDLREFRSVLPNLLHQKGFELVPLVIAVGDYVLTPEICVERKSLSDLFQSMSSGRLFNQVESMLKHYKVPVLLIEFNPEKAFCLLGAGDLTPDIKLNSITSQLTLLTIHFPQLRILWSKSEHATADMFKELMKNNASVDVEKAHAAGGGGADGVGEEARATAKELLMRLPGINVHNYRNVLREVDTIADLSKLSEEELRPLLGTANASKLYKFFRQPAPL